MSQFSFGACSLSSLLTSSNMDLKLTQTPNAKFYHSEDCTQDHKWSFGFVIYGSYSELIVYEYFSESYE